MAYQQKYLKYKSKYLDLRKLLGGTKEENNNYLLHGTNLFYIDDIKKTGLNGIYNQEIYNMIEKYWPIIHFYKLDGYVDLFLQRQRAIRHGHNISLSFTGKSSVANEYSHGARHFGEGPSRFLTTFRKYIQENREHISPDIIADYDFLENLFNYPGIILAINKDDFPGTKEWNIEYLDEWEHTLDFPIPADKLYIRRNAHDYIPLLSQEGIEYTDRLKSDFLEEERMRKIEKERIKLLEGWDTYIQNGPVVYIYRITKKNQSAWISAQYDIIDNTETHPHYLQLQITNYVNININITIMNILGSIDYIIDKHNMKGFELFMSSNELKEKFKLAIEGINTFIPHERQVKIYEKVIEIFPYLRGTKEEEEKERIRLLKEWVTEIYSGPILFTYRIKKRDDSVWILAQYDTNREEKYPHYLQLQISNLLNIDINITIRNILGSTDYEINNRSREGFELFMSNNELKEKFKLAIKGINTFIPHERQVKIYEKVIEIFPYLA